MQRLVDGVHHFRNVGFEHHRELFNRLGKGQQPEVCMITCSDSRIVPSLITNSEPGQMFLVRNVGNIVPCHGTANNGELAAVDFAVSELGVQDIIICGHTGCGAMKALLDGVGPDSVKKWLIHADATREIIRQRYGHLEGEALYTATAEENVLVQMEHLRTLPVIASRLAMGAVRLHGWMYKITTGEVFAYDSEANEFLPLVSVGSVPRDARIAEIGENSRGKLTLDLVESRPRARVAAAG